MYLAEKFREIRETDHFSKIRGIGIGLDNLFKNFMRYKYDVEGVVSP